MHEWTAQSFLQIRPTGVVAYTLYYDGRPRSTGKYQSLSEISTYTGSLSKGSIRRLKRCVTILAACAKWKDAIDFKSGNKYRFKLNFITLTLSAPQGNYTDYQVKSKVLDPFLKRCVRKFNLHSYVWRAEYQDNGNIHFHLMTDTFIHYKSLQHNWNQCQNKLGLIDEFEKVHGHRNPNSTDVHAVRKPWELARYIAKYMTKEDPKGKPMSGRCWSASQNLTKAKFLTFDMDKKMNQIWDKADKLFPEDKFTDDFISFIRLSEFGQKLVLPEDIKQQLQDWKDSTINRSKE